ncbi:unnamed protein product, partial [Rotaria sp. Silwood2]
MIPSLDKLIYTSCNNARPSIRQLDFLSIAIFFRYFNSEECVALAMSSLECQCAVLLIDIKNRTNVLDHLNRLSNLRSLTMRCEDDRLRKK